MLRRLDVETRWRSLVSGFWPEGLPASCKTVSYDHDGSGKSTVSEFLRSLAGGHKWVRRGERHFCQGLLNADNYRYVK